MIGLGGNDIYRVSNAADQITETAGNGTNDRVITTLDFTLGAGDDIELFTTDNSTGTDNLDLTGNEKAQTIVGNAGNNRLDGKGGSDLMNALGGNDTFVFSTALGTGNIDQINGYNPADDQIELHQAVFTQVVQAPGTMLSGYFKANATGTATDANDRIIYNTTTGALSYDEDGNGAGCGPAICNPLRRTGADLQRL